MSTTNRYICDTHCGGCGRHISGNTSMSPDSSGLPMNVRRYWEYRGFTRVDVGEGTTWMCPDCNGEADMTESRIIRKWE